MGVRLAELDRHTEVRAPSADLTDGAVSSVDGDAGEYMGLLVPAGARVTSTQGGGMILPSATSAVIARRPHRRHDAFEVRRQRWILGGYFVALLVLLVIASNSGMPMRPHASRKAARGVLSRHTRPPPPPPPLVSKAFLKQNHSMVFPPPSAPYPPMPPFPRAPPLHLTQEPSALSTCGHLAVPVDTTTHVPYPGGVWQYFAEWSGLDEQAEEEVEDRGRGSYAYDYDAAVARDDGRFGHSYDYLSPMNDGGRLAQVSTRKAAAAAQAAVSKAATRAELLRNTSRTPLEEAQHRIVTALRSSSKHGGGRLFGINADFSLAYGLRRAKLMDSTEYGLMPPPPPPAPSASPSEARPSNKPTGRRLAYVHARLTFTSSDGMDMDMGPCESPRPLLTHAPVPSRLTRPIPCPHRPAAEDAAEAELLTSGTAMPSTLIRTMAAAAGVSPPTRFGCG